MVKKKLKKTATEILETMVIFNVIGIFKVIDNENH